MKWRLLPHQCSLTLLGAAYLANITTGAPRLYHVDMKTDKVVRTYSFDLEAAPHHSYLNDVRISTDGRTAFLTDSNTGGLRVLDLESGFTRNVLSAQRVVQVVSRTTSQGSPSEQKVVSRMS